jgi:hypothetical protein
VSDHPPIVTQELRALIRTMSATNPLWGAPRIHGELLKLGFTVSQTTVAKYMVRRRLGETQATPFITRCWRGDPEASCDRVANSSRTRINLMVGTGAQMRVNYK